MMIFPLQWNRLFPLLLLLILFASINQYQDQNKKTKKERTTTTKQRQDHNSLYKEKIGTKKVETVLNNLGYSGEIKINKTILGHGGYPNGKKQYKIDEHHIIKNNINNNKKTYHMTNLCEHQHKHKMYGFNSDYWGASDDEGYSSDSDDGYSADSDDDDEDNTNSVGIDDIDEQYKFLFASDGNTQALAYNGSYISKRRATIWDNLQELGINHGFEVCINMDDYKKRDGTKVLSPFGKKDGLYYVRFPDELNRRMKVLESKTIEGYNYKFQHDREWVYNRLFFDEYD